MTEIAALGLKVTGVSDSDRAAKSLDGLARSGKAAEDATDGLSRSLKEESKSANQASDSTDRFASIAKRAAAAAAGAFAVSRIVSFSRGIADLNSRYEQLGNILDVVGRNAGYSSDQVTRYTAEVQAMGITMTGARETIVSMVQAQLDLSKASELARLAQDAAAVAGVNSSEALSRIIRAVQTNNVETLRTVGINVQFEQGYRALAKTLGVAAAELTETQKAQARMNLVMEAGTQIAGSYEASMDSAAKQLGSTERYVEDLQIMWGQLFSEVNRDLVFGYSDALKALLETTQQLTDDGSIDRWGKNLSTTLSIAADIAGLLAIALGARLAAATVAYTIRMVVATRATTLATASQVALASASRASVAAMTLLGGPLGVALFAAGSLAYFVTRTNNTIDAAKRLEDQLNSTAGAFDAMTVAQARSERVDVTKEFNRAESELDKLQNKYDEMRRRLEQRGFDLSDPDALPDTFVKMEKAIESAQGRVKTFSRALVELNDIIEFGYSNDADPFDALTDAAGNLLDTAGALDELTSAQQRNQEEISKNISALERAAYAWGLSAGEVKILDLAQQGATETQLDYARALIDTVEGWEKAAEAQSNYLTLVEDLRTDEEKLTDQLRERLAVLDAIGTATEQDYSRTAAAAFSDAPQFGGLAPEVGGAFGELSKINDAKMELQGWYDTQLEMLENYRAERADLTSEWDEQEAQLRQEHQDRLADIDSARQQAQLVAAEETFGGLADLARGFAGEQSGIYKALLVMEKAAAIQRATVAIQTGLAKAWELGWPAGIGAAAAVISATAPILGNIRSANIEGFQAGGYTGNMGVSDVAGVVHGREFVFDAAATQRIGPSNLEAMRSGKNAGGGTVVNIHNAPPGTRVEESQGPNHEDIIDIFVANVSNDGRAAAVIQNKWGLTAQGR